MRESTKIIIAASVSLFFHSLIFVSSPFMVLRSLETAERESRELFRIREVTKDVPDVTPQEERRVAPTDPDRTIPADQNLEPVEPTERRAPEIDEDLFAEEDHLLQRELDILKAEEWFLKEGLDPEKSLVERPMQAARIDHDARADIEIVRSYAGERSPRHTDEVLDDEPSELPPDIGQFLAADVMTSDPVLGLLSAEDITELIELELRTYSDPQSGDSFFEAKIGLKEPDSLAPRPKEVVFLIDSSRSMTPRRFEEVIRGMRPVLDLLGPEDYFNIVAFSVGVLRFSEESVRASQENIASARRFLHRLSVAGQTDIEGALLDIVRSEPAREASYICMITDGRPTAGIKEVYKLLNIVKDSNVHDRGIYNIGIGFRVDRELLDFISLQNRGKTVIPEDNIFVGDALSEVIESIRYPVLTSLEYNIAGVDPRDVYPRKMTDLFRSGSLRFYGKMEEETDFIAFEIYGETAESFKKFDFVLDVAKSKEGSSEIAQNWAEKKVYDLLSQIFTSEIPDRSQVQEVRELSERYDIRIPYELDELEGSY